MPSAALHHAVSAPGLITLTQNPNIGNTVTASQIRGTPQPQGPSSTAVHMPSTAINTKMDASVSPRAFNDMGSHLAPDSAQLAKHLYNADPSQSDGVFLAAPQAVFASAVNQLGAPGASQSHNGDVLGKAPPLRNNTSASSTRLSIAIDGKITTQDNRSQTITANPESQNILTSGLTLSKDSAPTLGSGHPTTVLTPQTSVTQPFNASDSLSSLATTMGYLSKDPPFLTTSAQTVTADSLGRYPIDSQLLTKSGMVKVSGTMISLAPNGSHIHVGMSTVDFGPSATVNVGSGSNGTEVQTFSGNALGARDGLWGSSTMLLVFFVVLLWL